MLRDFIDLRILVLVAAVALGTCPAQAEPAVEIILAHGQSQNPPDDPVAVMAAEFKQRVEEASNGAVLVHIFPDSRLGGNRETAKLVERNVIQTALVTAGGLVPQYPLIAVTQFPFLIDNRAAGRALYDGPFGQQMAADMQAKTRFVILGFGEPGGLQIITNSQRPIIHPQDLSGLKIRSVPGFTSLDTMIRSLGAKPVKVSSREEYNALGSGVVDGQMVAANIVLAHRFDQVQTYATLTNHLYSPYIWIFNKDAFDALPPDTAALVRSAAKAAISRGYDVAQEWEASAHGMRALRLRLTVQDLSAAQRAEFAAVTQPAVKAELLTSLGPEGEDWINRLFAAVQAQKR